MIGRRRMYGRPTESSNGITIRCMICIIGQGSIWSCQRVASPFINEAQESLQLYRVLDPNTWGKMVGRVNGVNFTGMYGGTHAMGWAVGETS